MMSAVFDSKLKIAAVKRKKTRAHEGGGNGLKRIIAVIRESLNEADIPLERVKGIGIGIPGPIDMQKGVVLDTPNLGWGKLNLKTILEKEFPCVVHVINDVDAGVYGEYCFGAAKKVRCVLGVFPGTGIGGGCIYKGEVFHGSRSCLEIGHLQVVQEGPLCGCGQRGCLESMASRLAIATAAAKAAYIGEAPHLMEITGANLTKIRSKALTAAIEAGDQAIEQIIRDGAYWLGIGVANVINLLAPDIVILGGGLVEAIPDIYREVVEDTANKHVMPPFKGTFKVTVAALGDDAVVTGAAAWAVHQSNQK
jgi:glucokinase